MKCGRSMEPRRRCNQRVANDSQMAARRREFEAHGVHGVETDAEVKREIVVAAKNDDLSGHSRPILTLS
jgi:hypothetical protein